MFLEEIVKKKISTLQDINWAEFKEKFPNQTSMSMTSCLVRLFHNQPSDEPFYKRVAAILPTLKNRKEVPVVARRREELVALYDKIRFTKQNFVP